MRLYPQTPRPRTAHEPGISLIVVVSLVGLLSLLAVSLLALVTLSRQTNHLETESRKCEALAESAFRTVFADLTDEMNRGSASVTENKLEDGSILRLHDLTGKQEAMVVSRAQKATTPVDGALAKQSASGVPFHTRGGASYKAPARASAVSSTDKNSSNYLDPAAWDKPRLLKTPRAFDPKAGADTVPPPDWVYVSRDGTQPSASDTSIKTKELNPGKANAEPNPKYVVGRYAYNLYDTSGLLDINVAGHPAGTPDTERVSHKGTLVMADLAGLPGMTPEGVSQIANWKHEWEGASADKVEEYLRLSEGSGWQVLAANDNLFLNRQDMLRFAKLRPQALPETALPSLTHFSRDLDAPNWKPHPKRPKVARSGAQGGNDAYNQDDTLNPDLTAFDKNRKRQLLPRRFPLERLKWVATPGKDGPADPDKAERYFGLRWKGTHWEYVHARPDGRMYTLQDVPSNREPNFFEILRATVFVGSLGRQFAVRGHDAIDQLLSMHQLPGANGISGIDASVNLNIIEMGASIIDQADADSYPTAIAMPGMRLYYVFGKEDVPYIHRMSAIPYRGRPLRVTVYNDDGSRANSECYEGTMVLQPMLWRPHQIATGYGAVPTNFRIRPRHVDQGGGAIFYLTQGWDVPGKGPRPGVPDRSAAGDYTYWGGPNYRTDPKTKKFFPRTFVGDEYIDVSVPAGSSAFREPQSVHSAEHGAQAGYTIGGNAQMATVRNGDLRWDGLPTSFTKVAGFICGYALTAKIEPGSSSWRRLGVGYFRGDPIEVLMEYEGPDGSWRPYQFAEFTYKSNWGDHYLRPTPLWETEAFHWSSYIIDPRTARFGGIATVLAGGLQPAQWTSLHPLMTWPEGASIAFGADQTLGVRPGWSGPAMNTGWNYNGNILWYEPFNPGAVVENNQKAWDQAPPYDQWAYSYKDPDDVLRPGVAADYKDSIGNPMSRRCALSSTGKLTVGASSLLGRPRILNRPFRSVGELAHSFRGTPWRDIDFLNPSSPDAGLLEVFSLYDNPDPAKADDPKPPVVAGRVNINSAGQDVLAALLRGAAVDTTRPPVSADFANQIAAEIQKWLSSKTVGQGPLTSKGALVASTGPDRYEPQGLVYQISDFAFKKKLLDTKDISINDRREFLVRALSDGTTVRSWNFLLDLVVQSGQINSAATTSGSKTLLHQFQASAERRFWVHFAIDRLTGRLLDIQWEPVND